MDWRRMAVWYTVYPKKYAHGFVVLCFVVVMHSFIMNSHEVFIHIHQGCFAGTGAIVRLPQCRWSKPDGYGKISQCITTIKHSKAKTVCIFLGIYCRSVVLVIRGWCLLLAISMEWWVQFGTNSLFSCATQQFFLTWWRHEMETCSALLDFVRWIHRSPATADSTHKGQWRGALKLSLIYAWINGRANNRDAGDLRRHCAHHDVTVMNCTFSDLWNWRSQIYSMRNIRWRHFLWHFLIVPHWSQCAKPIG